MSGESRASGQNIILDLIGAKRIHSAGTVERALRQALEFAKALPASIAVAHSDANGCVTAAATLPQGLVRAEAWPHTGYVAVDLAGTGLRPELAMTALADAFDAREIILRRERIEGAMARLKRPVPGKKAAPRSRPAPRRVAAKAARPSRAA